MSQSLNICYGINQQILIKTTPGTTLKAVVDQACKRVEKLGDSSKYGLKWKKQWLDLSALVRHLNLPQGVKLDLKIKDSSGSITVGLQLPNGQRFQRAFVSTVSFAKVIEEITKQEIETFGDSVCVTVMNIQYRGIEKLKNTNFQSLGINTGSVLMKLNVDSKFKGIEIFKNVETKSSKPLKEGSEKKDDVAEQSTSKTLLSSKANLEKSSSSFKDENMSKDTSQNDSEATNIDDELKGVRIIEMKNRNPDLSDERFAVSENFYKLTTSEIKAIIDGQKDKSFINKQLASEALTTNSIVDQTSNLANSSKNYGKQIISGTQTDKREKLEDHQTKRNTETSNGMPKWLQNVSKHLLKK
ncbi:hypothetical protein BB560_000294 [Smittium megazygosporum]|uniref:TUG ubiquitin-like domain-containing protein n=1 Tax=Smittium megazygosporum TaxID=133381 RepID=A0A2T9ZKY9_9FUNG|nr:hypothetical protein BB560_000294 [Smittium megazygosporum]